MKLTCPECGAHGSATMFASDATARQALALSLDMPSPIQAELASYLALFRPQKRVLSWGKIKRTVVELDKLVKDDRLTWDRQPPVKCPPRVWAEAMQVVVDRQPATPLKNHNYLRAVAYELAAKHKGKVDAQAERDLEGHRQSGRHRPKQAAKPGEPNWTPDQKDKDQRGGPIPVDIREGLEKSGLLAPKEEESSNP